MKYSMVLAFLGAVSLSGPAAAQGISFGNDSSQWANDGECDDPRFSGPGMTGTTLLEADAMADASDCRAGVAQGSLMLIANFGNDSSEWANDGECDDPRFYGPGMTATTLLDSDIGKDASDCKAGFDAGVLLFKGN